MSECKSAFMVNHYLLNQLCRFDIKFRLEFSQFSAHVLVPRYNVVSLLSLANVVPLDGSHFLSQITVEIWPACCCKSYNENGQDTKMVYNNV